MRIQIQIFISIRIRIQGAKPMRIYADPDPGQILKSQKVDFYMKNILKVGKRSKTIPAKVQKPFWKAVNQVYFEILVSFHLLDPDLDPGQPNECGSGTGYTKLRREHWSQCDFSGWNTGQFLFRNCAMCWKEYKTVVRCERYLVNKLMQSFLSSTVYTFMIMLVPYWLLRRYRGQFKLSPRTTRIVWTRPASSLFNSFINYLSYTNFSAYYFLRYIYILSKIRSHKEVT